MPDVAPVLVLGLGNLLLQDDAAGLRLLEALQAAHGPDPRVDFVDGGTQGLMLLSLLEDRNAVLLLDAVGHGAAPGTVHHIEDARKRAPRGHAGAAGGAHQMNAGDLLATAELLGQLPPRIAVIGIEPAIVRTGIGLSPAVAASVPAAAGLAATVLHQLVQTQVPSCTN